MKEIVSANYDEYLQRMHNNVSGTKGIIPLFAKGKILDVGCADGSLMKLLKAFNSEFDVHGIDLNEDSVRMAKESGFRSLAANFIEFIEKYKDNPESSEFQTRFDTIIFSSILHEFYSYNALESSNEFDFVNNSKDRLNQLAYILNLSTRFLNPGGRIIIRDGVGSFPGLKVKNVQLHFQFHNLEDSKWLMRFKDECKDYKDSFFESIGYAASVDIDAAKEFFFTFTWGEDSWDREVNETYGVLTTEEWRDVLPRYLDTRSGYACNLDLIYQSFAADDYAYYLSKKIKCNMMHELMRNSTCLSVYQLRD